MGRIKTQLIKRLTMDVIKDSKERCTTQFEDNKKVVAELLGDASKKMRNSVAGYVTRLMKVKEEY
ncbi:MAG: 30S ribosomal protein S17e [Candidatus Auribacter fodinae]|uniref:30S ribosomal protein S17e n=1 Tax=Candidatus Auribacter fodinae TaxID=2093366 RepID=A0A3A4R3A8_9BACT|nr:MAG: 30S ribosomal protein S17e [Candidatus Auribacter fodinae]